MECRPKIDSRQFVTRCFKCFVTPRRWARIQIPLIIKLQNRMNFQNFTDDFREAFGPKASLPLVFWYSNVPAGNPEKTAGCFFKALPAAREGALVSLNAACIGCGGGKFYTGFAPMPEQVPTFVAQKEHYKQTPQMVVEFITRLDVRSAPEAWLNFGRVDCARCPENWEGMLFFATPDQLAGLVSWACYDNNADDAVAALFGSGCSAVVAQAVRENRRGGHRTFLALFDPSVRPWVGPGELGFIIPRSRFVTMQSTMRESCLFGTHAWGRVRERIDRE